MTKNTYGSYSHTSPNPDGVVCGTVGQFMLLSQAADEYTIQWCNIGDPTTWDTPGTDAARANQAGEQTLNPKFGVVTGITGDEFAGYVFQERAITKMTYVGGDVVFRFETIEEARGCFDYNRFCRVEDKVFYQSGSGHHMLADNQVVDIGFGKVDESYPPVNYWYFDTDYYEQRNVAANPRVNTVFFEDNAIAFNYKTGHWTKHTLDIDIPVLFDADGFSDLIGYIRIATLAYMTRFRQFSGNIGFDTCDFDLEAGKRCAIDGVRVIHKGGTALVQIGTRDSLSEAKNWSQSVQANSRTGIANFRGKIAEGRYVSIRVAIVDFLGGGVPTSCSAFDVYVVPTGNQ